MSNMKDSCFRLFGKNIQAGRVYNHDYDDNNLCDYESISSSDNSKNDENRAIYEKTSRNRSQSTVTEDTKTVSNDKENSSQDCHTHTQDIISDETSSTKSTNKKDQKSLKKPDKIVPCPRCNSMTTKFCYFNNYNVTQPRHFCKDCQRYWTAGGTTRSMPVGAGRRKNKNSSLMCYENVNFQGGYTWNPMAWQLGFPSTSPNCSATRKHSRDGDDGTMLYFGTFDHHNENGRVLRGKKMKQDDPIEAANSSIWNTITVKNIRPDNANTITRTRFFGVPLQQYNGIGVVHERSNNPAAYSRSLLFQEIV